jgi:TetR/AcrR family transcriptional repressor of mexJK operon
MSQTEMSQSTLGKKLGRPKSAEKRKSILMAAENLILDLGYSATTMDLVAAKANVSKQTVYSHFKNKETLFSNIIMVKCHQYKLDELPQNTDLNMFELLYKIGQQIVKLLQREEVVAMYRVVIAEVGNNPQVAKLFYEAGPQQSLNLLTDYLFNQQLLSLSRDESYTWAVTFLNMLKGDFHFRSILGLSYTLSEAQQKKLVTTAVSNFLKLILPYEV